MLAPHAMEQCEDKVSRFLMAGCKHVYRPNDPELNFDQLQTVTLRMPEIILRDNLVNALIRAGMSRNTADMHVHNFSSTRPRTTRGHFFREVSCESSSNNSNPNISHLLLRQSPSSCSARHSIGRSDYISTIDFCQEYRRLMRAIVLRYMQLRCHRKNSQLISYKKCRKILLKFMGPVSGELDLSNLFVSNHGFLLSLPYESITLTDMARWHFTSIAIYEADKQEETKELDRTRRNGGSRLTKQKTSVISNRQRAELLDIFNVFSGHSDCCITDTVETLGGPRVKELIFAMNRSRPDMITEEEWMDFFENSNYFASFQVLDNVINDLKDSTARITSDLYNQSKLMTVSAPALLDRHHTSRSRKGSRLGSSSCLSIAEYVVDDHIQSPKRAVRKIIEAEDEQQFAVCFED